MKKIFLLLAALLALSVKAQADTLSDRKDWKTAVYNTGSVTASTTAIVVDLSDTVNFPHKDIGAINVGTIRTDVYKVAAASGTLKVGVLYGVSTSTGNVKWFYTLNFSQDAAGTHYTDSYPMTDSVVRTKVKTDGTTPYFVSNSSTTASASYKTTVNLPTSAGTSVPPAPGDIIVELINNAASSSLNATVEVTYYSEKP